MVPYNPGLHALVAGKNERSPAPPPEAAATSDRTGDWHQRGYLPHRDRPELTQFVTFRLADAFPVALRLEWEALYRNESAPDRRRQLETYLDLGRGHRFLSRPDIAASVENSLRHFHGCQYDLHAWVIMPNHVHVLVTPKNASLTRVVGAWKSYTSKAANRILNREGAFWSADYWDTWMRDTIHLRRTIRYLEGNPVRARLVAAASDWPWSSARFRDAQGALRLPAVAPATGGTNPRTGIES